MQLVRVISPAFLMANEHLMIKQLSARAKLMLSLQNMTKMEIVFGLKKQVAEQITTGVRVVQ